MLPTPLAFAWTIWRRHHWGLVVVLAYLVICVAISAVLPAHVSPPTAASIFGSMLMPIGLMFFYLLGVFSYGFDATDAGARESCFPAGLFRLPVRTSSLIGWPLLFGAVAIVLLWLITVYAIMGPWLILIGVGLLPVWWPAMLAVASLAWIQAMLWSGFGLAGIRILLIIVLINAMMVIPQLSVASSLSEGHLVGLFAIFALFGWMAAYAGVRRARCGDVPNWAGLIRPFSQLARLLPRSRQSFASAAGAQTWFEWRRSGNSLPIMTALVLPFVLLFLVFGENDVISTAEPLLGSLAVPVLLASIAGTTVSAKNSWAKDYYGVAPFTAALPMSTARLVAAKLKAAAWSALAAWIVVIVMVSLAVMLTGKLEEAADLWRQALGEHHPIIIVAGIVGAAVLLFVATWKRLVDSLLIGLTGRKWVIQTAVFGGVTGFIVLCIIAGWICRGPQTHEAVWATLPWVLGLFILARLLAAAWMLRRMVRQGLLKAATVRNWIACWLLLALLLFGLLARIMPADSVPLYYVAFGVMFALPMVRMTATPLALAWNRHR